MGDQRARKSDGRASLVRHGRLEKSGALSALVKTVAATLAVVLVSAVSVGAVALSQLSSNIETVELVLGEGEAEVKPQPPLGKFEGGFDILLVGSDTCDEVGGCPDREATLNDVTMLVHVAEDQSSAVAVSFPRDLVVPIPACPQADGSGYSNAMSAEPINNTLQYGGLPCTVLTVAALTGIEIPYAALIKFKGVVAMSNAVGGVDVCVNGPIKDRYSGLDLPAAGVYTLQGEQAKQFLRTRHGVGDGGDLGRISSQQVFLSSLVRKIKADSTLTDPGKLFGLATAATQNMELSSTLAPLNTMAAMALVLKDIPLDKITFVQYPGTTEQGGIYSGKVAPIKAQAAELFEKIKADEPFIPDGVGVGSVADPAAPSPVPSAPIDPSAPPVTPMVPEVDVIQGVSGQTAADDTCAKANG